MKRRTVYIVHSGHDHDELYTKGLQEGWGEEKWNIVSVNYLCSQTVDEYLYERIQQNEEEVAAIITINLCLFKIERKVLDFVLASTVPIAIWLFDHPALGEHVEKDLLEGVDLQKMWLISGEQDFIDCWRRYISPDIRVYHKSARASSRENFENQDQSFSAFQNKEIPLLIPCNIGTNPREAIECLRHKPAIKRFFYSALNLLVKNPYISTHEGIDYLFKKEGIEADSSFVVFLVSLVQRYVKHHRRSEVLFNLPSNAKILFLGEDYPSKFHEKFKNARFMPCVPLIEYYKLIKDSQIIINFECGPNNLHNRAYNAILTQTAFATHGNNFIDKMFQGGEDFIKYDLKQNDISEVLPQYLDNPKKTYELTVNARKKLSKIEMIEDSDYILEVMAKYR